MMVCTASIEISSCLRDYSPSRRGGDFPSYGEYTRLLTLMDGRHQ